MSDIRRHFEQFLRTGIVAVATAMLVMAIVFVANFALFSQGHQRVDDSLKRAIADGAILDTADLGPWAFVAVRIGDAESLYRHDCLIWTGLLAPRVALLDRALRSPRLEAARRPHDHRLPLNPDCQAIGQTLLPANASATMPELIFYDRYILAQQALAHLLLSQFSLRTSTAIVRTAAFAAFVLVFIVALRKAIPSIGVMSAVFLLFYGLAHFGGMLYFAPIDIAHAIVLMVALYRPFGTSRPRFLMLVGASYGSVVAIFEILTGGIPVGLAVLSLLTGISAPDRAIFINRLSVLAMSFAMAVVSCFVIKLAVVSLVFQFNAFEQHAAIFLHRINGSIVPETAPAIIQEFLDKGIDFNDIAASRLRTALFMIENYAYWSRIIGWGSSAFGKILVLIGLLLLLAATAARWCAPMILRPKLTATLLGCWLALGFLLGWVLLFWNHTAVHGFFMARLLVIPILSGAVAATQTWWVWRSATPRRGGRELDSCSAV